jgi:hypothetical protein
MLKWDVRNLSNTAPLLRTSVESCARWKLLRLQKRKARAVGWGVLSRPTYARNSKSLIKNEKKVIFNYIGDMTD